MSAIAESIHVTTVPEHAHLNRQLRSLLLKMAATIPDVKSNRPGQPSFFVNKWLSDTRLHDGQHPAIDALVEIVEAEARAASWPNLAPERLTIFSMWSIVSKRGMQGRAHNHKGAISGVYYVDAGTGETADDGALAIYGPSGEIAETVRPRSGNLLLWPSELVHGVIRYDGDRPRIIVSFNLAAPIAIAEATDG